MKLTFLGAARTVTGGRVLHHLKAKLPDPNSALLFVGFNLMAPRDGSYVMVYQQFGFTINQCR